MKIKNPRWVTVTKAWVSFKEKPDIPLQFYNFCEERFIFSEEDVPPRDMAKTAREQDNAAMGQSLFHIRGRRNVFKEPKRVRWSDQF